MNESHSEECEAFFKDQQKWFQGSLKADMDAKTN